MSNIFKKLSNIFTEEVPDTVEIKPVVDMKPLVGNNIPNTQSTPTIVANVNYSTQNIITPASQEKWKKYLDDVYDVAKKTNVEYNTFLSNIKIVEETDPTTTIDKKVKFAFAYMKNNGTTKEQLLASTKKVYDFVVIDRTEKFDKRQAEKTKIEVDDNLKSINDKQQAIAIKQQEIAALSNEINKLNVDINNSKENLNERLLCYNMYSEQTLNKIKEDIQFIQNYI